MTERTREMIVVIAGTVWVVILVVNLWRGLTGQGWNF